MPLDNTTVLSQRISVVSENNQLEQGTVAYWITRENRMGANWGFALAYQIAKANKQPLVVLKNIPDNLYYANSRTYPFFIDGIEEMINTFEEINVPVNITIGDTAKNIPQEIERLNISHLICDFEALKPNIKYQTQAFTDQNINIYRVDSRNAVPCLHVSEKQEYAARTIRPKINKQLNNFLDDYPNLSTYPHNSNQIKDNCYYNLTEIRKKYDEGPHPLTNFKSGRKAGLKLLTQFISKKLLGYSEKRNDPANNHLSDLSIYINHGFISRQEIAKEIRKSTNGGNKQDSDTFLEELIVRAELAENFCYYNKNYDSVNCFPAWAKQSLEKHSSDKRETLYSTNQLEFAKTHDPAWNATQVQLITEGKMHGYMRMYWAKKILEWTENHEVAHQTAIYLNDKYELDGRDPNGFVGIAWAIGGVHDQGWKEREIFGKIRYMNYNGLKRKFDIKSYENKYPPSLLQKIQNH